MSHNTPTEILARVKYKLIQDIGSLWACESITNNGSDKNKTPKNIESVSYTHLTLPTKLWV